MAKVSIQIKKGPKKGKTVSFETKPGRKEKRKKTAYQMFVGKKVRAGLKKVPKANRFKKACKVLKAAAKEWSAKKRTKR